MYANSCRKLLRLQRTACYGFPKQLTFSLSPKTLSQYWMSLAPPPAPRSPLPSPHLLPSLLQICVGKNEETDSFLRLSSGKKRGLVPVRCLLEIWWPQPLSLIIKFTMTEEYSGVFTRNLTDRHPPPPLQKWIDSLSGCLQLCFLLQKVLKVKT